MKQQEPWMIIWSQIGGFRSMTMIGAYDYLSDGPNALIFKFKASRKFNFCRIEYLPDPDLYKMILAKYNWSKLDFRPIKQEIFNEVYADQLQDIFSDKTGLCLSL